MSRPARRRGSVIIVVLVLIALASLLLGRFMEDNTLELAMTTRDADRRRLRADAQSELELALAVIAEVRSIDLNKVHHPAQGFDDPHAYAGFPPREGLEVSFEFEDESRKLPLPNLDQRPGELLLMTIRSHDQFNTTIYGLDDRYRGVTRGRMVLFANAADLAERGLLPGQKVTVAHERDGRRLAANGFTLVPYDLPRGNLAGYFPELNPVVPMNRVARNSGTPIYKSVPVTILRYEEPQHAAPNSPSEP